MNTTPREDNPERACPHCKILFTPRYKERRKIYCSQRCYSQSNQRKVLGREIAAKHLVPLTQQRKGTSKYGIGVCAKCHKEFRSRYEGRQFCSISCYTTSDEFQRRIRQQSKRLQAKSYEAAGLDPDVRLTKPCLECGTEMLVQPKELQTKKFCSQHCYRLYMAARFDRWIAAPQTLALPQGYDEFLTQEELPCLFDDCDWIGRRLGNHVNFAHGITALDFKALAGFNRKTALCTSECSEALKPNGLALAAFHLRPGEKPTSLSPAERSVRLEGREHIRKAQTILRHQGPGQETSCRGCDRAFTVPPMQHQYFCSKQCRTRYYSRRRFELECDHCGARFLGTPQQHQRKKRAMAICCSAECRNARNLLFTPNHQKHQERNNK